MAEEKWRSRGRLPHRDEWHLVQAITFRLADALPQEKLRQLKAELARLKIPENEREKRQRAQIEAWLDAGLGSCALKNPAMAKVVESALHYYDGERYRLLAWCVMPNHVHVLIQQMSALPQIVRAWKGYTGRWAMQHAGSAGLPPRNNRGSNTIVVAGQKPRAPRFWQPDYWDRFMRDERHFAATIEYIHHNPVKARLCARPEGWPWSSARFSGSAGRQPRNIRAGFQKPSGEQDGFLW
ncbi:MAG: transposase [Zoogloeaceae bacterium]|jgi:type I restriction enzyme R subunit/putative DNA methylase|nr:transposase [Zoogloeaceae bacterium]